MGEILRLSLQQKDEPERITTIFSLIEGSHGKEFLYQEEGENLLRAAFDAGNHHAVAAMLPSWSKGQYDIRVTFFIRELVMEKPSRGTPEMLKPLVQTAAERLSREEYITLLNDFTARLIQKNARRHLERNLEYLFSAGAEISYQDEEGNNWLHLALKAVNHGNYKSTILVYLAEKGVDADQKNNRGLSFVDQWEGVSANQLFALGISTSHTRHFKGYYVRRSQGRVFIDFDETQGTSVVEILLSQIGDHSPREFSGMGDLRFYFQDQEIELETEWIHTEKADGETRLIDVANHRPLSRRGMKHYSQIRLIDTEEVAWVNRAGRFLILPRDIDPFSSRDYLIYLNFDFDAGGPGAIYKDQEGYIYFTTGSSEWSSEGNLWMGRLSREGEFAEIIALGGAGKEELHQVLPLANNRYLLLMTTGSLLPGETPAGPVNQGYPGGPPILTEEKERDLLLVVVNGERQIEWQRKLRVIQPPRQRLFLPRAEGGTLQRIKEKEILLTVCEEEVYLFNDEGALLDSRRLLEANHQPPREEARIDLKEFRQGTISLQELPRIHHVSWRNGNFQTASLPLPLDHIRFTRLPPAPETPPLLTLRESSIHREPAASPAMAELPRGSQIQVRRRSESPLLHEGRDDYWYEIT